MRTTALRTAGVAGIAITGLVLAGCAGDAPAGGGDFAGTTLEVSATWSGAEQQNFEAVLDVFEQETGATVNYTSFGDNGATTLNTQVEGGNPPDVAVVGQPALMQQLATDGALAPLGDAAAGNVADNYAQTWVDLGTVDGELYGVWFKAANKSTMWYNADIYDEAGASEPEDWDGFLEQLQLVSDAGSRTSTSAPRAARCTTS
jgi:alpha-glucoside transport system substrate-binding protein